MGVINSYPKLRSTLEAKLNVLLNRLQKLQKPAEFIFKKVVFPLYLQIWNKQAKFSKTKINASPSRNKLEKMIMRN